MGVSNEIFEKISYFYVNPIKMQIIDYQIFNKNKY